MPEVPEEKVDTTGEASPGLPAVMTIEEAAQYTRISRSVLYQLIGDGKIATFKVGSSRRVRRSDLDAFIAERVAEEVARKKRQ